MTAMKTPLFATMALATGLAVTPALAQTTTNAPSHSADRERDYRQCALRPQPAARR